MTGRQNTLQWHTVLRLLAVLGLVVAVVAVLQTRSTHHASALAMVVNDLDDVADTQDANANGFQDNAEVADGICDAPGADTCTLRAAVFEANANGDTTDAITFDAALSGTINLGGSYLPLGECGTATCGANGVVDSTTIDGPVSGTSRVITVDCGSGFGGTGFYVTGASNVVRDLNIRNCAGTSGPNNDTAVWISGEEADNNRVLGNYIGTDVTGTACVNGDDTGMIISNGADGNFVGDSAAADRNVIGCSGNSAGSEGILITGSSTTSNVVRNNYIGTNRTGTASLGNGDGVSDSGTSTSIDGNLISGNNESGIYASGSGGTITGNTIGLQPDGSTTLGNSESGVLLSGSGYTVGGTTAAARNVISANSNSGVELGGSAASNTIVGNYIGTDSTGNSPRGNGLLGIGTFDTANGNTIGGSRTDPVACAVGPCNVLSGNSLSGVVFADAASNNDVQGNNIGIGADGLAILGNGYDGVVDASASGNRIGGTAGTVAGTCLGVCNRIAHNALSGVGVTGSATLIRRNEIFGNSSLGIDLDDDTAVDCPPDTGAPTANGGFDACPHILAAVYSAGTWIVSGNDGDGAGADVPDNSPVDIYEVQADPSGYGEGKRWLATALTDGSGNWSTSVCVSGPTTLTAVVSDLSAGVSSEFGPNHDLGTGSCVLAPPATNTPTVTNTPLPTNTPVNTSTPTRTSTPTNTSTPTITPAATATATLTHTPVPPTATNTPVPPTATRTPTPAAKPCGDVNDDGQVNSVDAALILQLEAGLITSLPNMPSADVNSDDNVNSVDAALILQKEAGLLTNLAC